MAAKRSIIRGRPAFTFMEVLFSVMILGIGMIMVAAMFPAAIKQTQANVEDGTSASTAQLADQTMQLFAQSRDVNPTATPPAQLWGSLDRLLDTTADSSTYPNPIIYSFHDPRLSPPGGAGTYFPATPWQMVASNLVLPNDPQYAWVPLFARSHLPLGLTQSAPYTATKTLQRSFQLFVVPVRCRNRSSGYIGNPNITGSDVYADANNDPTNLDPALVNVNVVAANTATGVPAYIQVSSVYYGAGASQPMSLSGGANPQYNPLATGAYLIVSNCKSTPAYNGMIFKLGSPVTVLANGLGTATSGEFWSIAPDPNASTPTANFTADYALVVGRGPDTSSAAYTAWSASSASMEASPMPRAGVAQDLGIFFTVVTLP